MPDQSPQEITSFIQGEALLSPGYLLESAIESTVRMMVEHQGDMAHRLSSHLDALLVEQLRQVSK